MQNPNSYYRAPRIEDPMLKEWMRSRRATNSSYGSSSSRTLVDDEPASPLLEVDDDISGALQCVWTSSSSSADSDPFASRTTISSEYVDLPEIPFVSFHQCHDGEAAEMDSAFWLKRRPAASNASAERHIAVLSVADRALSHSRQRSGSVSSTGSRPAPAKSILSSSSSIKTRRGRSPPSVKFLDMPTIHYEMDDEDECMDYQPDATCEPRRSKAGPTSSKKRAFSLFGWFVGPNKKPKVTPDRPLISTPLPLWEGRRPSGDYYPSQRCNSPTSARSIRSVRSAHSMRSVRSCTSRFQNYWGRLGGKDP